MELNTATQDITVNVNNLNDNNPVITSNNSFTADENQTAIGTVTATDADGDDVTFTVSGTELEITSAGVLTFVSAPDYETKATYIATVTASDGTNSTTQDITVNVTNVNDVAPEFTSEATFSAAENQTAIGTVTATDAEGDDVAFTISGDELAITSAGVLTFVSAPDYETKASYTATVTASDGTNSTNQDITVNVTNVNDNSPVITSSNEYSLEENTTAVGQATATDADGDGIAFSITSESDISIDNSSGVIYFNTAPDYETATSHSAILTVSDGAFTSSQEITISVTDADEGPPQLTNLKITGLGPSDFINKSTSIEFTASDETDIVQVVLRLKNTDTNSFFQRTLNYPSSQTVNGSLTDAFFIDFNEQLRSGTYQISELALYDSLDKSINAIVDTEFATSFDVNNSNQETTAPELLSYTLTVSENTLTIYSLIKEEDSGISKLYQVDSDSSYSSTQELLNEDYNIKIHASDTAVEYVGGEVGIGDLTDNEDGTYNTVTRLTMSSNTDAEAAEIILYQIHDRAFNRIEYLPNSNNLVPVANANPIFISDSTFSVDENETGIGTASARNAKGDALTYSVSGSEVIINETSGVMVFASAPDYESKSTYTVTVTATDGTNSSTQEITININDVREQTIQVSVEANNNGSGNVYVINGTQRPNLDLVKGVTYTFVHPTGHPFRFSTTADGTHGGGTEYTTGVNTGSSGTTIIKVTDNTPEGLYYYCSIHAGMGNGINLIDNAPPEFTSSATFSADENQTAIGAVTATDAEGDAITYSISGSEIEITSAGVLSFVAAPDYETKSSYTATITANDGTSSSTQDVTVNINNLNDNSPSFTSDAAFSADENQIAIGTVTATDADGDVLTFIISGSELAITSDGVLTFVSAPDYETTTSYSATVTVSDGTNSTTKDITVNVTNVNDNSPGFTSNATFSAEENQIAIGTVVATDTDGDGITYSISGSDIAIDASSGVITFISAPDYETTTSYSATVTASDGTNSTTQDITVNVTNQNDNSPIFTSEATFSAEENQTAIGTVVATDADGDSITYSISGSDITINSSSGVIAFVSAPDYETTTSYTATVTASDGTNSTTQDIRVNVTNENESPALSSNAISLNEGITNIASNILNISDPESDEFSVSIKPNYSFVIGGLANGSTNPGYANDYDDISNYETFGSSDGSTFIVTSDTTLSGNYKITSNIQIADGVTLTLSNGIFWGDEDGLGSNWRDYTRIEVLNGSLITVWAKMRNLNIGYFNSTKQGYIELGRSSCINCLMGVQDGNTSAGSLLVNLSYLENVSNGSWMSFNYPSGFFNIQNSILYNSGQISVSASTSRSDPLIIHDNIFAHADDSSLDFPGGWNKYPGKDNDDRAYINYFASNDVRLSSQNNRYLNSEIPVFFGNDDIYSENDYFGSSGLLENRHYNSSDNATYQDVNISNPVAIHTANTQIKLQPRLKFINDQFILDFPPDYEARQTSLSYIIDITDSNGDVTSNELTISILNTNEAPFVTTSSSFNVQENTLSISDLNAIDPEGDDITFSVSGSELEISAEGVLTFTEAPDYESKTTYSATVSASDGTNSTTQGITVNVTNVNDNSPSFTSEATFSAAENQTAIGTVTATDADGDDITFSQFLDLN